MSSYKGMQPADVQATPPKIQPGKEPTPPARGPVGPAGNSGAYIPHGASDQKLEQDLLGSNPTPRRAHTVYVALGEATRRFPGEKGRAKRAAFVLGALWYRGNGMDESAKQGGEGR